MHYLVPQKGGGAATHGPSFFWGSELVGMENPAKSRLLQQPSGNICKLSYHKITVKLVE